MKYDKWLSMDTAPKTGENIFCLIHPEIAERSGCAIEICHYEERILLGKIWIAQNEGFSTEEDGVIGWLPLNMLHDLPTTSSK